MANSKKSNNHESLTLNGLVTYNQEVVFPFMKEQFAGKKEFNDFKDKALTNQDKMLKRLDVLISEKTVNGYQEKKQKKLLAIFVKVLKERKILTSNDLEEITRLEVF